MPRVKIDDERRVYEMYSRERELEDKGYINIAGIDEAGRGPLAGAVYAAAVILPVGTYISGVNDSKKLSEKKRAELYDIICEKAIAWSVAYADEREIDEINILNATHLAMCRAVSGLGVKPGYCIVDGNSIKGLEEPYETMVKGDAKSASIAAASILAKVSRDRYICAFAEKYPEYGFDKHKGYGTREHIDAILKYGALPIHRKSFLKKITGDN